MGAMASQITGVSIVYSTVCLGARIKENIKLRVTGISEGNSSVTGEFPSQSRASNAENASFWWRYHIIFVSEKCIWRRIYTSVENITFGYSNIACYVITYYLVRPKPVSKLMLSFHINMTKHYFVS